MIWIAALHDNITTMKGVGAARAATLAKLGISTLGDLIYHFPRQYRDLRQVVTIAQVLEQMAEQETEKTVGDIVLAVWIRDGGSEMRRNGLTITRIPIGDESGNATAIFFNQPYIRRTLQPGNHYLMWGKAELFRNTLQLQSPQWLALGDEEAEGWLLPIYPATAGITQKALTKLIQQALKSLDDLPDPLPRSLCERYGLAAFAYALWQIHFPQDEHSLELARKRLIFEELLFYQLALQQAYRYMQEGEAVPFPQAAAGVQPVIEALPYSLTNAQQRVWDEIQADIATTAPMNRLVQGDVGSGKTVIAGLAMAAAAQAGYQAAIMAPTEILALQHHQSLQTMMQPLGLRVGLLTGRMKAAEMRRAKESIAMGYWHVVVGTHALIQGGVQFDRLALVVTDEQHRFGVRQRAALGEKALQPHRLVMTATPIPRTLAFTLFGDVGLSVIDELPPGRTPVQTHLVSQRKEADMLTFIHGQIQQGRQCYMVCPLIEEGEIGRSVQEVAKQVAEALPDVATGVLHGRMKAADKEAALTDFQENRTSILIATTVVEVGVNIPNASVMVIWNADRFGLSQLHQLRGRVGRGAAQSYAFLRTDNVEAAQERLQAFCATNDGFVIAELDMAQRGIGDFLGDRQHGIPGLHIAAAVLLSAAQGHIQEDMQVVELARQAAKEVLDDDPASVLLDEAAKRHPQMLTASQIDLS